MTIQPHSIRSARSRLEPYFVSCGKPGCGWKITQAQSDDMTRQEINSAIRAHLALNDTEDEMGDVRKLPDPEPERGGLRDLAENMAVTAMIAVTVVAFLAFMLAVTVKALRWAF